MKTMLICFLILSFVGIVQAQRGIRLTSRISRRHKFIEEGTRVFYSYSDENHPVRIAYSRHGPYQLGTVGVGFLKIVNDSTISIGQEVVKIKNLLSFGKRKKGAWVGSLLLMGGGLAIVASSISYDPDTHVKKTDVGLASLGLACMTVGIIDSFSRIPKATNVWRVEVVK